MDKISTIISICTHDYSFMMWFWVIVTFPVGIGHIFYFHHEKQLSEKELVKISPDFNGINLEYVVFSFFAISFLMLLPSLIIMPGLDQWSTLNYGIRFYPFLTIINAGYGTYQGLFALLKGVYPMGKSFNYVYDDRAKIRRIAKYQILISISAPILVVIFFFATI